MINNWLYRPDRMLLREQALSTLLMEFGSELKECGTPRHSTELIYAAAHDWISSGNQNMDGIINFYKENYEQTANR